MTITVNITDTKAEQLRALQEHYTGTIEETASSLLSDAIRAKYNALPAEKEEPTAEQIEEDERAYFESFGYVLAGDGEEAELVDLDEL